MKRHLLIAALLAFAAGSAYCVMEQLNCVQSVVAGSGVTVTGTSPSPTVSFSQTDTQVETFTSSVTVSGNVDITGAITQPLTVTSSTTFTTNIEVDGFLQLFSRTKAQLQLITPAAVGEIYYCSDCTALRTCVSTGTAQGAFSSPVAATTACN